ncbi:hypothetical protein EW026_g7099 [Hermanssonia centrifuga]|uniref:Gustatory receptor n=1 Tax=Hermanssonia centrifuga TaxID=98765 RepID=A0A4S4K8W7_9APHY|nr:hypothetical protein EW026_g7099 [Hermanssonia centrifuga]
MLSTISFPFVLATAYWTLEVAQEIVRMHTYFIDRSLRYSPNITDYGKLFDSIVLLNYFSADAVVAWRAWALCRTEYKKVLVLLACMLGLMASSVVATIGVKIAFLLAPESQILVRAIDITQISYLVWSLLTNICATSIISHKTWRYRRAITKSLNSIQGKITKTERLLSMFIEAGAIYCLSGIVALVGATIRLPYGTFGDIYRPVNVQIAGMYPIMLTYLLDDI